MFDDRICHLSINQTARMIVLDLVSRFLFIYAVI